MKQQKIKSVTARIVIFAAGTVAAAIFLFIVAYILIKGIPHIDASLFEWKYNSENVSLMPALVNTLIMTAAALIISVPLGIGSAIYLSEYAARGGKIARLIRMTADTLAGIPSIVYGLFGSIFFVYALGWGLSLIAGAFTLAIMILPTIMRTAEEALRAVPDMYREGSFGLGAGRLRTVAKIVLPSAINGILAGIILAVGRIVGESAALIYTAGTVAEATGNIMDPARTLAVHMYSLSREGLYVDKTYATAVVLLVLVIGINALSAFIAKRVGRKTNDKI